MTQIYKSLKVNLCTVFHLGCSGLMPSSAGGTPGTCCHLEGIRESSDWFSDGAANRQLRPLLSLSFQPP